MILTQFDKMIKVVRTDNGLEFLSEQCQSFFLTKGVIHHKTCPYSPQQNGVVERKHKHLLQIARALMFQSAIPSKFWTEAILTATFIVNRLPTSVLQWKSPYEVLYNKPVDYSVLKVFPFKNSHATADSGSMPIPDPLPEDFYISTPTTNEVPASMVSPAPTSSDTLASSPVHTDPSSPVYTLRRSTRVVTKPSWLSDFVCSATSPSSSSFLVAHVGPSHYAFTTSLSTLIEPKNYAEANTIDEWRLAMKAELAALEDNNTWEVVPLPQGTNAIGCRWVYKLKLRADGSVDRYKARLVAKGYSQVEGIDYNECFSPVAKVVTVRLFLAISAIFNWHIHQLDVNNAFLHGYLDEDIFMEAPEGFHVPQSKHDYCLFTKHSGSDFLVLLLYVDDILLAGSSTDMITEVKVFLDKLFTIKDLGTAKYFLGLEIARSSQGIIVTQAKYTKDIVLDVGLDHARSTTTPLPPGIKFSCDAGARLNSPESYRRLVGRLLYLNFTRPDISHTTQQLSQFLQSPCQQHWDAALHLVRYLKGSLNKVSWKTKKQNTVSRSTAEAEYRSMGTTVCELTWIVYLLRDFGVQIPTPIPFLCDNQAALHIVANPVFHERTNLLTFSQSLVGPLFLPLLSKLALIDFVANPTCEGVVRTHGAQKQSIKDSEVPVSQVRHLSPGIT
ncbi:UNVERIFIED_CONTAM: Retrovirus-related Pol polyprotein from transposon RE1 [Sesamum calycinum]|uniref:Retrovirus-related Pol polyprotein from transposon RE1 n=1 Tax=Sesamum calycinum TaxID=2727403 RepID=A0AAW2T097_9LAMI